jgi:putative peptidoglycan lipid II flippase
MLNALMGSAEPLSAPATTEKRMLADTATVGFWSAVSKVVGALKIFIAARLFGTGDAMDAYLVAFLLPAFIADVLAAPMDSVLVPAFVRARKSPGGAGESLYSEILILSSAGLACIALGVAFASAWILPLLGASFTAEKIAYTRYLFFVVAPVIPLSAPWVVARSALNAEQRFATAAFLPVITPALSIAVLLMAGRRWGVEALAVATTAGVALQAAAALGAAWRAGFRVTVKWAPIDAAIRAMFAQYAPVVALSLVAGSSVLIDQAFAGALPRGSVSALNYGTRLAAVLMSLGPLAVGTIVLAHASHLFQRENTRMGAKALVRYAGAAVAVSAVVVALLIAISEPALRIVLRGGSFTSEQVHDIAQLQSVSLLQVPVAVLLAIGVRLIAAASAYRMLYGLAVVTIASNIAMDALLTRWWGLMGIVVAGSLVRLVSVLYVFCKFRRFWQAGVPANSAHDVS